MAATRTRSWKIRPTISSGTAGLTLPYTSTDIELAGEGDSRAQSTFSGSLTIGESAKWQTWMAAGTGGRGRLRPANSFGVGGDTDEDILARLPALLASTAQLVVLHSGTNDFGAAAFSVEQAKAAKTKWLTAVLDSGRSVVLSAEWPRFTPSDFNAAQQAKFDEYRAWMRSIRHPRIAIADSYDLIQAADLFDGLHPYITGAAKGGLVMGTAARTLLPSTDPFDSAGNVLSNPTLTGTAGTNSGGTGSIATGYIFSLSATNQGTLACVGSKTAEGWQQLDFTGTPTGANNPEIRTTDISLATQGWVVGQSVEGMYEFEWSGATNVAGIATRVRGFAGASALTPFAQMGDSDSSNLGPMPASGSIVQRVYPFVIPDTSTVLRFSVVTQFTAAAATLSLRIKRAWFRLAV